VRRKDERIPMQSNIPVMPYNEKLNKLPYYVVMLVTGAEVRANHQNKADVVCLFWNNSEYFLHLEDFELIRQITEDLWKQVIVIGVWCNQQGI